jgi:hypothetical protein
MKRYNIKVVVSMDVIADNETDASGAIQEMSYEFLETTGCAHIDTYEISDYEITKAEKLTQQELDQLEQYA